MADPTITYAIEKNSVMMEITHDMKAVKSKETEKTVLAETPEADYVDTVSTTELADVEELDKTKLCESRESRMRQQLQEAQKELEIAANETSALEIANQELEESIEKLNRKLRVNLYKRLRDERYRFSWRFAPSQGVFEV